MNMKKFYKFFGYFFKRNLVAMLAFSSLCAVAQQPTLERVKSIGLITLGVRDSSGVLSYLYDGKYYGFQVDICKKIVEDFERQFNRKISIQYVSVTPQNRIQLLQNGSIDLECGSTTNNLARQELVQFTHTTFSTETRMAVRANSNIENFADLNGKVVSTTRGVTSVQSLKSMAKNISFSEVFGSNHLESFQMLESGKADAFVMDDQILAGLISSSSDPNKFKIIGEVIDFQPIGIMFRKSDSDLKRIADHTIESLISTGGMVALYEKWFMQPIPPRNIKLNLPVGRTTKFAWASPSNMPLESFLTAYNQRPKINTDSQSVSSDKTKILAPIPIQTGSPDSAALNKITPILANRRALVIGNDTYRSITKLQAAREDARTIASNLTAVGYQVTLKLDLNEKEMKSALRAFASQVQGGDEVMFFFAGHGVQLGSTNYLLPTDIVGDSEAQVRDEAIQLQRVLDDMSEKKAKFTLAMIDACRDNPFKTAGRAIGGRGLAPTTAATGQMVIFSAGTGQQALDRLGNSDRNKNGLFTRVFVQEMQKPNVSIDRVVKNVRNQVAELAKSVGHEQVPAIYDQVLGDFYFKK